MNETGAAGLSVTVDPRWLFHLVSPREVDWETREFQNVVGRAIPAFFILSVLEWFILWVENKQFRMNDSISSVTAGMLYLIFPIAIRYHLHFFGYEYIYDNYRLATLPEFSWPVWLCGIVAADFCYYWFHRKTHEINILWALHQVHHSSEDYNLTTALRQSVLQKSVLMLFFWPMALAISPGLYLALVELNMLGQFWVHTTIIPQLGPLELILSTPSSHRVHHGSNEYCLDKNYGGIFIVWDRLFGTYQPELPEEPVRYGLTTNVRSWDPIWIQCSHLVTIAKEVVGSDSLARAAGHVFRGPGWVPGEGSGFPNDMPSEGGFEGESVKSAAPAPKYDGHAEATWLDYYCFAHMLLSSLQVSLLIDIAHSSPYPHNLGFCLWVAISLISVANILEQRPHALPAEFWRCLVAAPFAYSLAPVAPLGAAFSGCYSLSTVLIGGVIFRKSYINSMKKKHR